MRLIATLLITPLILVGCNTAPAANTSTDTINVAASFYPLAFVAERIGGMHATVKTVTPPGAEPHDFEPTARDIADLQSIDLLIFNGAGLDPWADRIAPELTKKGVTVVRATDGLTLRENEEHHDDEESGEGEHEHGATDPHVWLDPTMLAVIATTVEAGFSKADPAHTADYRAHAEKLRADLATLDTEFQTKLAQCELHDIIVSHDAFSYLGSRYGITPLAIAGLSPDTEPSPARLAELATLARQKNIRHIFFETLVSPRLSDTLAREIGAETLVLNPIESLTSSEAKTSADYLSVMRDNLAYLRIAMRCE